MGTDQIMYCIVALILGMLLANMLKSVCGCKVVEGHAHGCCQVLKKKTAHAYQDLPACWTSEYTYERCCDRSKGTNGDTTCWDGYKNTFQNCCPKEFYDREFDIKLQETTNWEAVLNDCLEKAARAVGRVSFLNTLPGFRINFAPRSFPRFEKSPLSSESLL